MGKLGRNPNPKSLYPKSKIDMSWSGLAKFLIGFFMGIFLLVTAGSAVAFFLLTRLAATPPKPIFAEEIPKQQSVVKPTSSSRASKQRTGVSSPKPSTASSPQQKLEPGAYNARVTWREGVILRAEPSVSANKVGGVQYNQPVVVVKESDDKNWQQVRAVDGSQEGWIKSGNIERVNTAQP